MIDKPLESFSGFVSGNSVTMFVDDQVVPGFVILKFISPLDNLAEIAQWPITKAETRLVRFKLSTKEKKKSNYIKRLFNGFTIALACMFISYLCGCY